MNALAIRFDPEGIGHCLYSELIDLNALGSLQIRRASRVEFNNQTKQWEVKNLQGRVLYANRSRADCLGWENQHLIP